MTYYTMPGLIDKKYIPVEMTNEIRVQWAQQIIKTVAVYYGCTMEQVQSKGRQGNLPRVCQFSAYIICMKIPNLGLKNIAELFGSRYLGKNGKPDHSAICHNRDVIADYLKVGDDISKDLDQLLKLI